MSWKRKKKKDAEVEQTNESVEMPTVGEVVQKIESADEVKSESEQESKIEYVDPEVNLMNSTENDVVVPNESNSEDIVVEKTEPSLVIKVDKAIGKDKTVINKNLIENGKIVTNEKIEPNGKFGWMRYFAPFK